MIRNSQNLTTETVVRFSIKSPLGINRTFNFANFFSNSVAAEKVDYCPVSLSCLQRIIFALQQ